MRYNILIIAALLFTGCGSIQVDYTPSPNGDEVDVRLQDREWVTGEFISIDDTAVYVILSEPCEAVSPALAPGELVCVPLRSMVRISVNGYSDRSWLIPVAVLQVLPAVLMGIAAERYEENLGVVYFGISIIPGIVTAILFEATTPRVPDARWPFPVNELEELRKYARYPAGLPPGAVEALLAQQNQRAMRYIP